MGGALGAVLQIHRETHSDLDVSSAVSWKFYSFAFYI